MATYYKYAERSAESQVNWAEIGKNMTDMLRQEVQVRDQKKAALDEATRQAAQQISNAPRGQHVGAKTEAIRLADQATKYLLMQNRLMKQGILDPKDYMISHQNLSDGIKTAYSSMKAFQENYGKLMERAQKDESSMIELKRLEKIQGYGNFSQSGFFIDAPTGNLNVGLKEEQTIDGEKVIGLKKGSTVGMQYIDGAIYGQIDKYKYQEPLKVMADRIGEVVRTTVTPGTLNQIGYTKYLNDARQRINEMQIGSDDKKILYDFYQSAYDAIGAMLTNENHKASLLVDAMASKGYFWTDDPEEAAKNPKAVLEVIDPNTGRAVMKFNKEQDQAATDFMMQQFLGMIDVKEDIDSTGFVPRPPQRTAADIGLAEKKKDAVNVAQNLVYALTGDANQSSAGTKYMTGLTGLPFEKTTEGISLTDEDGNVQTFKFKADGKTLADPTAFTKSFIGPIAKKTGLNQDDVIREFNKLLPKGARLNETTVASGFDEQAMGASAFESLTKTVDMNMDEPQVATNIQSYTKATDMAEYLNSNVAPNLGLDVSFSNGLLSYGQSIYVEVGGKSSPNYSIGSPEKNKLAMRKMKDFLIDNLAAGATPEERDIAAEDALRNMQLPKGAATTGTSETSAQGEGSFSQFND